MTVDLTALEAADAALQKSTSAAASTKAMSAANLAAWKAAYPVVTPPTGIVKAAFVLASGDSGFVASLPAMLAAGYNTFKFPSEWSNSVAAVARAGAKAWLTAGAFYNSGANAGTFELTAAQQIADLETAFKVIPVGDCYIYLADEPRVGSTQDRDTLYSRMAQIRSAIPGAKFVIAYYDAGTIGIYGPSGGDPAMDLIATDIYINKFGYNTGLVTALNQAATKVGIKVVTTIAVSSDTPPVPTAVSQIQPWYDAGIASGSLGVCMYQYGGGAEASWVSQWMESL